MQKISLPTIPASPGDMPRATSSRPIEMRESISVFDIFKIGVGPSSSHTMGPWRASQKFVEHLRMLGVLDRVTRLECELFGSLAKTGKGHGTDVAVLLGLCGEDPVTCDTTNLVARAERVRETKRITLGGAATGNRKELAFDPAIDLLFRPQIVLPFHPNALTFTAQIAGQSGGAGAATQTYYSVGGGFIVQDPPATSSSSASLVKLPHPIDRGEELLAFCSQERKMIPQIVMDNENAWRAEGETRAGLLRIWRTMQECIFRGCHTDGVLPGGLGVTRRAAGINRKLLGGLKYEPTLENWRAAVRISNRDFDHVIKWVSTFALAVNEENACFGRVVTAPTNGAAGVIPAVLMYYDLFCNSSEQGVIDFMLTAGEVGSIFKKGATISAAMGGCQAEIGVSSAMAAAGLTQVLGGSPAHVCMAAEIAMEHHLGMTCDPIGGLVQIPCIERNTMGAIKAITAASIAMESDPAKAKVSLDGVVATMWATAKDMGSKYKETAEGGLAVHIPVNLPEC
jgi:L-serine dehydratase